MLCFVSCVVWKLLNWPTFYSKRHNFESIKYESMNIQRNRSPTTRTLFYFVCSLSLSVHSSCGQFSANDFVNCTFKLCFCCCCFSFNKMKTIKTHQSTVQILLLFETIMQQCAKIRLTKKKKKKKKIEQHIECEII